MQWPNAFEAAIRAQFPDGDALLAALDGPTQTTVLTNPAKAPCALEGSPIPWNPSGLLLPERPQFTYDPLFHAGVYYPQESSSMVIQRVVSQLLADGPEDPVVLDLCAAPGGKSLNVLNALGGRGMLLSNEVIRPRAAILAETLTKWGYPNILVTQSDPKAFRKLEGVFDLVVVDAPCSGEGMFRKDPPAADHWSPEAVELCAARQKRILADVADSVTPGGYLVYATCTFNPHENDENVRWLQDQHDFEPALPALPEGCTAEVSEVGWRFVPHRVPGEGLFVMVMRRTGGAAAKPMHKKALQRLPKPDKATAAAATEATGWNQWVEHQGLVCALPAAGQELFLRALEHLHLIQAGTPVGKLKGRDLLPEHAWAQSHVLSLPGTPVELEREAALAYLARQPFSANAPKGWTRFTYQGRTLGLGKSLGNRINNYYPKHWRIRHLQA